MNLSSVAYAEAKTGGTIKTYRETRSELRIDPLLSALVFCSLTLALNIRWGYTIDDELFSIALIEKTGLFQLFISLYGFDVAPPGIYFIHSLLHHLVSSTFFLSVSSVGFSGATVYLLHRIFITESVKDLLLVERIFAVFLFSTIPLVLSRGHIIRWYPVFGLSFLICLTLYLQHNRRIIALSAAGGLMTLISFAGFFAMFGFGLSELLTFERPLLQRFKRLIILGLGLIPSSIYLFGILANHKNSMGFTPRVIYEVATGFFGGMVIGFGNLVFLIPAVLVSAFVVIRSIPTAFKTQGVERTSLLIIIASGLMFTSDVIRPYSFWHVALLLALLTARRFTKVEGDFGRLIIFSSVMITNLVVIGNIQYSDYPFHRSERGPFPEIVTAIGNNFSNGDLLITSEPNILTHLPAVVNCVLYIDQIERHGEGCTLVPDPQLHVKNAAQRVFVLEGRDNIISKFSNETGVDWDAYIKAQVSGRNLIMSLPYRQDRDTAMKNKLSKQALPEFVFHLDVYQ